MRKALAVVLLPGGSLALALATNLGFAVRAGRAVEALQGTWWQLFSLDRPEFGEGFRDQMRVYAWPPYRVLDLGGVFWILALAVALVGWCWCATADRSDSAILLLPALTPALLGLALAPPALIRSIVVLAENGLSNPGAAGAGVAQATATVCLGAVFSSMCMLAMLRSRRASGAERRTQRPERPRRGA